MCGIVGIVSDGSIDQMTLIGMRDAISHRGPDDAGLKVWPEQGVGLATRRLSIIDLSEHGHQPMANEDGSIWITFNGEIYNFKQLRLELEALGHVFSSDSYTEVVIHSYEEWGETSVERLRGMFAYALFGIPKSVAYCLSETVLASSQSITTSTAIDWLLHRSLRPFSRTRRFQGSWTMMHCWTI